MKNIEDINILVVGDIMLDKYVIGDVKRISPEAPVPVVNVTETYHTLGGCGNVVRNIKEMGANVSCVASIGDDINGELIDNELEKLEIENLLVDLSEVTTTKERIVSSDRQVQMLRIDTEVTEKINHKAIISAIEYSKKDFDIIVVSDYNKGVISSHVMNYLRSLDKKIIVDPKPVNSGMYSGVHMVTPNHKEWDNMILASQYTLRNVDFILVTKGKNGMTLYDNKTENKWDIETDVVDIYNVSGAGDTVVAVMSICMTMGWGELDSAYIANQCAGYVVTQPGTSTVPKNKFIQILKSYKNGEIT